MHCTEGGFHVDIFGVGMSIFLHNLLDLILSQVSLSDLAACASVHVRACVCDASCGASWPSSGRASVQRSIM